MLWRTRLWRRPSPVPRCGAWRSIYGHHIESRRRAWLVGIRELGAVPTPQLVGPPLTQGHGVLVALAGRRAPERGVTSRSPQSKQTPTRGPGRSPARACDDRSVSSPASGSKYPAIVSLWSGTGGTHSSHLCVLDFDPPRGPPDRDLAPAPRHVRPQYAPTVPPRHEGLLPQTPPLNYGAGPARRKAATAPSRATAEAITSGPTNAQRPQTPHPCTCSAVSSFFGFLKHQGCSLP